MGVCGSYFGGGVGGARGSYSGRRQHVTSTPSPNQIHEVCDLISDLGCVCCEMSAFLRVSFMARYAHRARFLVWTQVTVIAYRHRPQIHSKVKRSTDAYVPEFGLNI